MAADYTYALLLLSDPQYFSIGAGTLDPEAARATAPAGDVSEAERLVALEQEVQDLRKTLLDLRGALDPLASAKKELGSALAQAQGVRAAGRSRAENVRAEAQSRAARIIARAEHRAQQVLHRGRLDADRIEARSHSQAEEIVNSAHRTLHSAVSQAGLASEEPAIDEAGVSEEPFPDSVIRQMRASLPPLEGDEGAADGESLWEEQPQGVEAVASGPSGSVPIEGPSPVPTVPPSGGAASAGEPAIELGVASFSDTELRCTLQGPLSFAALLAMESAIKQLSVARSVEIVPTHSGAMLAVTTDDPERTLQEILALPGFPMRLREA